MPDDGPPRPGAPPDLADEPDELAAGAPGVGLVEEGPDPAPSDPIRSDDPLEDDDPAQARPEELASGEVGPQRPGRQADRHRR